MRTAISSAMATRITTAAIITAMASAAVVAATAIASTVVMAATIVSTAAGIRFSRNATQHSSGNNCRRENHFLQPTAPVIIGYQPLSKLLFTRVHVTSVQ